MFTLKFFQYFPDGSCRQECYSRQSYKVITTKDGVKAVEVDGDNIHIKPHGRNSYEDYCVDDGFDVCFIENQSGKTIDRITC